MSVQADKFGEIKEKDLGFNTSYVSVQVLHSTFFYPKNQVSIHHMCRFKPIEDIDIKGNEPVSIHHMCRFKCRWWKNFCRYSTVSIHHMCRFKRGRLQQVDSLFCCFNTSYVSVQEPMLHLS